MCGAQDGLTDSRGDVIQITRDQRKAQTSARNSPAVLATWRRAWGCDCDGVSHTLAGYERTPEVSVLRKMAEHIAEITGYEPPTCPWRVFYDPLVRAVIHLRSLADDKLAEAALGPNPPAILLDAYAVYKRAHGATLADEMEHERLQREAQRNAQTQSR